jgi:signal recognition particle receptor subunit beta
MALFNYANREITAKLVYYGPGVCGKTTSLQYIHERIAPAQRGRLLSLATETDRTIFFDLLPLKLGEIRGFKLRFQLYTVPGQVKYNKTRKLVLQGADAIVFVADSQGSRKDANIESFQNLQENLKEQGKDLEELPLVYAYNKRDLENLLSIEELNQDLNSRSLPHFPAVATQGIGVMETLEAISKLALQDIEKRLKASATVEVEASEDTPEEEFTGDELLDLTGGGETPETPLTFPSDELDELTLESDLSALDSDDKTLETRPIGYDNDIPIQEVEIREEDVAHAGTLRESEFFNLKEIEEQALRELDQFIEGSLGDESFTFDTFEKDTQSSLPEQPEEDILPPEEKEEEIGFMFTEGSDEEQSPEFDESGLDFSFDMGGVGQPAADQEESSELLEPATLESDNVLEFNLDEEPEDSTFELGSQEGTLTEEPESEPLDLSENDLELSLGEEEAEATEPLPSFDLPEEDVRGEPTSLTTDEDELIEFNLDEESQETDFEQNSFESSATGEIEPLDFSEDDLDLSLSEEETGGEPLVSQPETSEDQSPEPSDFD